MTFLKWFRFFTHLACWLFFMGWAAFQIVFQNQYWAILMFFIFLALFILTVKEFSEDAKVKRMLEQWREDRSNPHNWSV